MSRGGTPEVMERWAVDAEAVGYAMKRAGMSTWAELANAAGLSENATWMVGTGRSARPSAATLCALARALGCDALDLMREAAR